MRALHVILAALLVATAVAGEPNLEFEEAAVVASGFAPGAQLVLAGEAHDYVAVRPELLRWTKAGLVVDAKGRHVFELGRRVPRVSVWVVIDPATGQYAAGGPNPQVSRVTSWQPGRFIEGPSRAQEMVREPRGYVDVLLVRPGVGAWFGTAGDGANDADGVSDGSVALRFADLRELGDSQAVATSLQADDLVVSFDPSAVECSISRPQDR
ncbi:MAG TPA: hypothetical protein PKL08_15005 [Thermoanaerobaculaceae bacterium]|nr:hypothetical protein [Thermoanaerobaculaceae bacterium]